MERLAQRDMQLLLAVLAELNQGSGLDTFPQQILPLLGRLVPCEIATYNEVQPRAGRIAVIDEPRGALPPDGDAIFGPFIAEHPLIQHAQQTGDGQALKISDFLSQRQFHDRGIYQEFFRVVGVEHQIAVTLPTSPPLIVGIALNRGRGEFSERERLLCNLLRPHLVQAYRTAAAWTRIGQTLAALERALEAEERGIVLLYRTRERPLLTAQARRLLAAYFGHPLRRSSVMPEVVVAWLERQRIRRADDTVPYPATPFVVQRGGRELQLQYLAGRADEAMDLLVLRETALPDVPSQSEDKSLTPREQDVLRLVVQGQTDRQIGRVLGISERTVHKHLEHLLAKIGVGSRTAAATWALRHSPQTKTAESVRSTASDAV